MVERIKGISFDDKENGFEDGDRVVVLSFRNALAMVLLFTLIGFCFGVYEAVSLESQLSECKNHQTKQFVR